MATDVCTDVWRRVVPRLDLPTARSLQAVLPGVVEAHVAAVVRSARTAPVPAPLAALLDAFVSPVSRGFQQRVSGACILLSTPHDATLYLPCGGGAVVVARACRSRAHVELRIPPTVGTPPGFGALEGALQALRWTADALTSAGLQLSFGTRVAPSSQAWAVLVDVAQRFVEALTHTGGPARARPP